MLIQIGENGRLDSYQQLRSARVGADEKSVKTFNESVLLRKMTHKSLAESIVIRDD